MLSTLVSHNQDLRKLVEKGYAVSIDSSNLVVRDIPYLDSAGTLQWGAGTHIYIGRVECRIIPDAQKFIPNCTKKHNNNIQYNGKYGSP